MYCKYHPERVAAVFCEKNQVGFCRECCEVCEPKECCECLDINLYCQFRSQCLIWALSQERKKQVRILK
jgi:hypothetical protein